MAIPTRVPPHVDPAGKHASFTKRMRNCELEPVVHLPGKTRRQNSILPETAKALSVYRLTRRVSMGACGAWDAPFLTTAISQLGDSPSPKRATCLLETTTLFCNNIHVLRRGSADERKKLSASVAALQLIGSLPTLANGERKH
jgi:hypothetical protein